MLIGEFAAKAGCSEPTVVRLARRLGYEGYPDLREDFAASPSEVSVVEYATIRAADDPVEVLNKVFDATVASVRDTAASIGRDAFVRAVDATAAAGVVMFAGVGDAALVALEAHQRFVRIGVASSASLDLDLQLILASQIGKADVLIVFSHSGRSRSVLEVVRVARRSGATVVAVTNFPVSPIAKRADILLQTAAFSTTPTGEVISKRVTELCVLEALHLNVLLRKGKAAAAQLRTSNAVVAINKL
jgi:RpiR family carbohydrate utilization transcriptional regulator